MYYVLTTDDKFYSFQAWDKLEEFLCPFFENTLEKLLEMGVDDIVVDNYADMVIDTMQDFANGCFDCIYHTIAGIAYICRLHGDIMV